MIVQSNTRVSIQTDIFVKERDFVNDLMDATSATGIYILHTFQISKSSFNFSKILRTFFVTLSIVVFKTITVVPMILTYLVIAPLSRAFVLRKVKKLEFMHDLIKSRIEKKVYTTENLIAGHKLTKEFLDRHTENLKKLDGEIIFRPALNKFLSELKKIELTQRMAAYPKYNEIPLSYDEIKELSILMKDFECASEQSDVYH